MSNRDSGQYGGPWVGYRGASAHTNLSEIFLRHLVMRGDIPIRKIGRRVLFSIPALDAWVNRNGAAVSSDSDAA